MLRCERCKVYLPDNPKKCPLCGNPISGTADEGESFFPVLTEIRRSFIKRLIRWFAFVSICVVLICLSLNIFLLNNSFWSFFIIAGIGSFWLDFIMLTKKYKHSVKNILWQTATLSIIALLWDIVTGFRGWSVDFVFPILCICSMSAIFLYSNIRKLHIQDYIFYILINCVLSIVSLVVSIVMTREMIIPSVISFIASIIYIMVLLFFHRRSLSDEIRRRTHL